MMLHCSLNAAAYVGSRQENKTLGFLNRAPYDFIEAPSTLLPFNICMNALLSDQL